MAESAARLWPADGAVLALAAPLVKTWEGLRLAPYRCSTGHATIGWGTRFYPDGRQVAMGDRPITESEADGFLAAALGASWARLKPLLARDPSAHQAAAMLSLAYNIGESEFAASTLLRKFNAGDVAGAGAEFARWCHGRVNGKLVAIAGLLGRRRDEAALFLTPDDAP
ncbi:MAG TPA: lysozyme [Rhizomicrobium sp.]|nr:lysozyme [Rhizomicrobium sp.]